MMVKSTLFFIDLIGNHSGMHYYHTSILASTPHNNVITVLSNYEDINVNRFFPNIFKGNLIFKIIKFSYCYFKLSLFLIKNNKKLFVYSYYGSLIDTMFLLLFKITRVKIILDVHDIIKLDAIKQNILNKVILYFITKFKYFIIHNTSVEKYLSHKSYHLFYFPHPRYNIDKNFDSIKISPEIQSSIETSKLNLLFFGHIRYSKGIIELFHLFNSVKTKSFQFGINIIVAGQDTTNIIQKRNLSFNNNISSKFILRHISNHELIYLFKKCDIILLPYKNITQSGIVEMAINFQLPMLLSNINYFIEYKKNFPSFCEIYEYSNSNNIISILTKMKDSIKKNEYYKSDDLIRYDKLNNYEKISEVFDKMIQELYYKT